MSKSKLLFYVTTSLVAVLVVCAVWDIAVNTTRYEMAPRPATTQSLAVNNTNSDLTLIEQQKMSVYAFWQMWISFGALAVSAAALIGLWQSLLHTRSALNLSKSTSEAEITAYVTVTNVILSSDSTKITIRLINRGNTPVLFYSIRFFMDTKDDISPNSEEQIREACKKCIPITFTSPEDEFDAHAETPKFYVDEIRNYSKSIRELNKNNITHSNPNNIQKSIYVCGIVEYTNIYKSIYESMFSFQMDSLHPNDFLSTPIPLSFYRKIRE